MNTLMKIVAGLLLALSLQAHQILVQKADTGYEAIYWAHENGFIKYDKHQLKGIKAFGKNAKVLNAGIDFSGTTPKLLIDGKPLMVTLFFDGGYWTKTIQGFKNIAPKDAKGVIFSSLKSVKFSKTLLEWDKSFKNPVGLKMEVTPLVNPFNLKIGDKLPVLVTKDGKAFAGASFETSDNDDPTFKTNAYGIAYIPILKKGLMIIAAKSYMPQVADMNVENITVQSALVFKVNE
jgi:nickel transport protein